MKETTIKDVFTHLSGYAWQYDIYTGELRVYGDGVCHCPITLACQEMEGVKYLVGEWQHAAKLIGLDYGEAELIADLADSPDMRREFPELWEEMAEHCNVDAKQGTQWTGQEGTRLSG